MPKTFHGGVKLFKSAFFDMPEIRDFTSGDDTSDKFPPLPSSLSDVGEKELSERLLFSGVDSPVLYGELYNRCERARELSKEKKIRIILDCTSVSNMDFTNRVLIKNKSREILAGLKILMRASSASEAIIIADDSHMPTLRLLEGIADGTTVRVEVCRCSHPMHSVPLLIYLALGREMPSGEDALRFGCIVADCEAAVKCFEAYAEGKISSYRYVAVSTPDEKFLAKCAPNADVSLFGEFGTGFSRVLLPTPSNIESVGTVDSSTRLIMSVCSSVKAPHGCIGCGDCEAACPMYLPVMRIGYSHPSHYGEIYKKYSFSECLLCGCCSAVCPSGLELRDMIKEGSGNE